MKGLKSKNMNKSYSVSLLDSLKKEAKQYDFQLITIAEQKKLLAALKVNAGQRKEEEDGPLLISKSSSSLPPMRIAHVSKKNGSKRAISQD